MKQEIVQYWNKENWEDEETEQPTKEDRERYERLYKAVTKGIDITEAINEELKRDTKKLLLQ